MTDLGYRLEGESIGSCACKLPIDCFCWNQDESSSDCDSFVAYYIQTGKICGVDVSYLVLVQVVREAAQKSFFYVDAKGSDLQQELLLRTFRGELGGILADLSSLLPEPDSPRIAPIRYAIETDKRASLWIGNVLIRKNMSRKRFCFKSG